MPDITQDLRNFIINRGSYLYRYENGVIQQMVKPYNRAKAEVAKRLAKVEAQSIGYTREWRISRLKAQLGEIEAMLQTAAIESGGGLEAVLREFAGFEANVYAQMLKDELAPIGVNIRELPLRQIDFVVQEPLIYKYRGWMPKDAMLWTNNEAVNLMRAELTQAIIQGEDMARAANRLIGLGKNMGGEVGTRIRNKASIIARSEIQHVSNEVARGVYKENMDVLQGVTYLATLDNRTCVVCMSDDGKTFKFKNGEDHNGPILPRHPLCRCFYSPLTKSWRQLEKEEGVKVPKNKQDYYLGKAAAVVTYQKWLKGKENNFIKALSAEDSAALNEWLKTKSLIYPDELPFNPALDILGKERYKLWRSGKLTLTEMAKDNKILTLEELGKKVKKKK